MCFLKEKIINAVVYIDNKIRVRAKVLSQHVPGPGFHLELRKRRTYMKGPACLAGRSELHGEVHQNMPQQVSLVTKDTNM